MSSLYEHYPIAMWIVDGVLWAIGLLCWIATYIGAPLESRKRGIMFPECREFLSYSSCWQVFSHRING